MLRGATQALGGGQLQYRSSHSDPMPRLHLFIVYQNLFDARKVNVCLIT